MSLIFFRALLAQLDRAFGFEPKGRGFKSLRARHLFLSSSQPFGLSASVLVSGEGRGLYSSPAEG